jgi:hypothetical protein
MNHSDFVRVRLKNPSELNAAPTFRGRKRRLSILFGSTSGRPQLAKVAGQRRNGVADSLPLGSGNLDLRLGPQRLPLAHPLQSLIPGHNPNVHAVREVVLIKGKFRLDISSDVLKVI